MTVALIPSPPARTVEDDRADAVDMIRAWAAAERQMGEDFFPVRHECNIRAGVLTALARMIENGVHVKPRASGDAGPRSC